MPKTPLVSQVPDEDQIIHRDWIQYYDQLPTDHEHMKKVVIGVDLAISQKDTADNTAMVSALITGYEESFRVYILPNPINAQLDFPKTIACVKDVYNANKSIYSTVEIFIEDVGYQQAVIQQLDHDNYQAKGIKVTSDKRSRLMTVSNLIKNGQILFPRQGADELIRQLVGFGVERYDDLVDAFTIVGHQAIEEDRPAPGFFGFMKDQIDNPPNPWKPIGSFDWFRRNNIW